MLDYKKVYLTPNDLEILDRISSGAVLRLHIVDAEHLEQLGFISHYALSDYDDEYVISLEGLRYHSFLDAENARKAQEEQQRADREKQALKNQRRKDRIEARRYWITTLIALAALVKAFQPEIRAVLALLLKRLMPQ